MLIEYKNGRRKNVKDAAAKVLIARKLARAVEEGTEIAAPVIEVAPVVEEVAALQAETVDEVAAEAPAAPAPKKRAYIRRDMQATTGKATKKVTKRASRTTSKE
jgi:hypothetical protein